ncbi:uncharacterized protein LOC114850497 [Betta splendens]|uniref:Uncharacterized protein LOC114850497 n=1 Tax=Betta splendens TaxID=158456 RepID=A0A6P7LW29_BETSP|nr:uncharacterized protein LOC114850497 [Betta splendens]
MWASQQRHLECIQDPPDMIMYRVARITTINKVDVPYYKCLRGSNSLEGFHKMLPNMIPGPHCAARPNQVYLISGIARWNADRSSDAVFGGKGRRHRTYSAPLIDRLNRRCEQLFGTTEEGNYRAPVNVASNELLGLEYLFSQSTGGPRPFSLQDMVHDGPGPEEEVVQPGHQDTEEADEAYQSDPEAETDVLDAGLPHINMTSRDTSTVHSPAFEDACSPSPLPGFDKLEKQTAGIHMAAFQCHTPPPLLLPRLAIKTPVTSTVTRPLTTVSSPTADPSSQTVTPCTMPSSSTPLSWARSNYYKRKRDDQPSALETKVKNLPACALCGKPTQGHSKYKKRHFAL